MKALLSISFFSFSFDKTRCHKQHFSFLCEATFFLLSPLINLSPLILGVGVEKLQS
jgi:hypothetical protein